MRNASLMLALAAATLAAPSGAQAQLTEAVGRVLNGGVDTRTSARVDTRTGVRRESARDARDVPPGHLPGAGSCRVWIDGVPPGRQPRATDCTTAERDAVRYGSRARVIYGAQTSVSRRGTYDNRTTRNSRTYDTTINGRRCRVHEWYDEQGRLRQNTVCEGDRSWPNGTWGDRRDGRDDDEWDDRRRDLKRQKKEVKRERKELERERKEYKREQKGRH